MNQKVLAVNVGSSSLKFKLFEMPMEHILCEGRFLNIGFSSYAIIDHEKKDMILKDHKDAVLYLKKILEQKDISLTEIDIIGHRIVHGGVYYQKPVVIDEEVIKVIDSLYPLAIQHQKAHVLGIELFTNLFPHALQVAVFDTEFYQSMPIENYLYAVPKEWEKYGVRKYGFHGISHEYLMKRYEEITGKKQYKIITCHLGNGGSITATINGRCFDTSMGFTPNAGIMMGSRAGDIDASIIPYMAKQLKVSVDQVNHDLNEKSGLYGISGISSDLKRVEEEAVKGNKDCILALKMYIRRILGFIADYYVALGGVDAIIFSGGVGENSIPIRAMIFEKLEVLGAKIDFDKNQIRGQEGIITKETSSITGYVIPTNEELLIARYSEALWQNRKS